MKADHSLDYNDLDIRIGIHTGKIIAGIIGSKIVKYDIFGENVLIASKIKSHALLGKVCASDETLNVLKENPRVFKNYEYEKVKAIEIDSIKKTINIFTVEYRDQSSVEEAVSNSSFSGTSSEEDNFENYNLIDRRQYQSEEEEEHQSNNDFS